MRDSEKALGQIIAFANKHAPNKVDEITSAIKEMNKLVDRDVPKKPKDIPNSTWVECPNCGDIKINKFCPDCGQAIEWSEGE